ncbi:olfactory receptor 11G2-like [Crotalus tigris]|uniref:olfactory receptor 11G2-like n=1 Tax=Crotalus tigris TaxID=88082 RepID=UPI00192F643A|nr:olfactory receptor 11G2-like [Crotalus tigris]XP_039206017.1 olfactory receptor 11G2-like [Crotalus tigris]XP_039206018.1 olfactory receptor 11G2-like [Crotalus tigris]
MELTNRTTVQEFILLGLESGQQKRFFLLILFTIVYISTLAENAIIIMLVHVDVQLAQLPMYNFLGSFSLLEICYVTTTMPRMLFDLASPQGIISFQACFIQFYIFYSLGSTEAFFLSTMALDRYLAICHPLYYPTIMSPKNCSKLVASCWMAGFLVYAVPITLISRLSFCGPNVSDHFLCDQGLLSLACPPLGNVPLILFSMNIFIILGNLIFVAVSYGIIVVTLIKSSNQSSRKKAFSTISFHVVVVTLFYGSVAGMYVTPGGKSQSLAAKIVTVFYTAVTPFLNPMIYSLRNHQVKEALGRVLRRTEQRLGKR